MTSPDRPKYFFTLLLSAVAVIAIVNPKTIHLFLGGDQQVISPEIKWPVLLFDFYLLLLPALWLLFRGRPKVKNLIINQVLLVGSGLAVLAAAKTADLVLGQLRHNWDLVFLPNTSAHYVTPEFDYTADINRFGFRGPKNLSNLGGDSYDVLMIGDSFTFGWGLTDEETWPRRVEQRLRDAEPKVRIFNLGRPGYGPGGYVEVARRAVPILDPDLVVVNILQGDDLFQLAPGRAGGALRDPSEGARSSPGLRPREYFRRSLRNLHGLMRRLQGYSRKFLPNLLVLFSGGGIYGNQALELDIASDWVKQGEAILQTLSSEQRGRFEMLDDTVKVMFTKGWLNPYLVRDGVSDPGRFFFYEDLKAPATQIAIRNLAAKLQEIKDTAKKYSCDLLVSLVPYTPYVSSTCQPAWKGMGYALDGRLLFSNSSEAAIQEAAQMAGLDFYSPLAEFREAAKERQLYYEYDGHFNPAGAELYAQFMAELLETRVLRSPSAEKAVRGH